MSNVRLRPARRYHFIASKVCTFSINIQKNTATKCKKTARFYYSYEEYKKVTAVWNNGTPRTTEKWLRTIYTDYPTIIDITTTFHIYLNGVLVQSFYSDVGGSWSSTLVPGDYVYIQAVLKTGGSIVYTRDVYGQYYEMKKPAWLSSASQEVPEQFSQYIMYPVSVNANIKAGDTSYGYVTRAGSSTLGGDLGTTVDFAADAGSLTNISYSLPSNYDDFLNKLRSRS